MTDEGIDDAEFQAHVELLQTFLTHRGEIVERIQEALNAQRMPVRYLQDHALLSQRFEDCFFASAAVTADRARLRGRLEEAHWQSGFRPRQMPELHNDLVHPAEMMRRAFYCWRQTRWPGRNGRVRYAHTLFNVYLIRCLELLGMRLWDAGSSSAGSRLAKVQRLLDELWKTAPGDQPRLVRDARWLIPLAQSPTTDELAPYFEVARHVAESLAADDRLEMQKAHVQMIGGHLRSQIRHYCIQDRVSIDERSVVLRTRTSNALDFGLLIQNLVPLLEAYDDARASGDASRRLEFASAVLQGISADPALFIDRIDLLGAYSMIEDLFISAGPEGTVEHTPLGSRHIELLREYEALVGRLAQPLHDDCHRFRPVAGEYSPYGAIYGTPSNLTEHIALKTIQRDAETRFGLEDVFTDGDADKLAWVNGWRKLPHIDPEVQKLHEYPQEFADAIFDRIEAALRKRASGEADGAPRTGQLFVVAEGASEHGTAASPIPDLPARYVVSSDPQVVARHAAEGYDETKLLRDRKEGYFALTYETSGGWVALRKDMLTEVLGAGQDAKITGLTPTAAEVLRLMCPNLVRGEAHPRGSQASVPPSMVKA